MRAPGTSSSRFGSGSKPRGRTSSRVAPLLALGLASLVAFAGCAAESAPPDDPAACALTTCGTACTNVQTDPANCGACGVSCGAGLVCNLGACSSSCAAGLAACG